jgi:hypothetical protein
MTNLPDDHIDPYESRLTRRVDAFAEQAVRPINAAAIAAAAHAGARRQTLAGRLRGSSGPSRRLGLVVAAAVLAATSISVYVSGRGPTPSQTPAPAASPAGIVADCGPSDVSAEIVAWEGAAGHRIATVRLLGMDSRCKLPPVLRPALIDGSGRALIVGAPLTGSREWDVLGPGDRAETLVDMSNYCGAEPTGGLFLRLSLSDTVAIEAHPAPRISQPIDPPPCNGPNAPARIEIQPLGTVAPNGG